MSPRHDAAAPTLLSPRLDLPLAVAAWMLGFLWIGLRGSWLPLAALAVLLAARLVAGDPGTRALLRPSWAGLALGLVGAAALIGATYGLYRPCAALFPGLPAATRGLYSLLNAGGYPPAALALLVLVMSVCEEVAWRGRTLSAADAGTGARRLDGAALWRVVAVGLLYGAAGFGSGSPVLVALSAGCGVAWGLLRVAGGSLWPAIVAHALWDLAVLVGWPIG
jgi:membrane protease YdiL (CAAX protease family)